jgi:hypothetical protein
MNHATRKNIHFHFQLSMGCGFNTLFWNCLTLQRRSWSYILENCTQSKIRGNKVTNTKNQWCKYTGTRTAPGQKRISFGRIRFWYVSAYAKKIRIAKTMPEWSVLAWWSSVFVAEPIKYCGDLSLHNSCNMFWVRLQMSSYYSLVSEVYWKGIC